jgi:hypothetical protein
MLSMIFSHQTFNRFLIGKANGTKKCSVTQVSKETERKKVLTCYEKSFIKVG